MALQNSKTPCNCVKEPCNCKSDTTIAPETTQVATTTTKGTLTNNQKWLILIGGTLIIYYILYKNR